MEQITSQKLMQMAILAMLDEGKTPSEIGVIYKQELSDVWHSWRADKRDGEKG